MTELRTDRLLLRPWRPEDAGAVFAACCDPAVPRGTAVPTPYTRADADAWTGPVSASMWQSGAGAPFAVLDADSGEVLASVGIHRFEPRNGLAEIGYWAAPAARGRGVVTEATAAVCRWAFEAKDVQCIELRAEVGNEPSRRVAEKVGFRYGGTLTGALHGRDAWIATMRADDAPPAEDVIDADGLVLRPWRHTDAPALATHLDAVTMQGTSFAGPEAAEAMVARRIAGRWLGESRSWAVEEDSALVGGVALYPAAPAEGVTEVGYVLAPGARGRGLAGRSVRLALVAAARAGAVRLTATVIVGNTASCAVAKRVGMRLEGVQRSAADRRGERVDLALYAIIAGDPGWPDLR